MTDREALQRRIRRFINRFVKLCEHQYWVYSKTSACSKHHWLCHSESCLLRAPLTPEACFPWRFSFSPWKRLQAIKLKRMSSPLQANDQIEYRSLYCEPPPPRSPDSFTRNNTCKQAPHISGRRCWNILSWRFDRVSVSLLWWNHQKFGGSHHFWGTE